MSTIPNSAIPHAIDHDATADEKTATEDAVASAKEALGGLVKGVEDFAREVGDRIKGAPKGAQIAAGAVAVAGLVAAAAVPLVRAARKPSAPAKPKRAATTAAPRARKASTAKASTTRARKPKSSPTA